MIQFLNRKGSGTDTSDATAISNDLILGKTAYAQNEKITGNIKLYNDTFVENLISKNDNLKYITFYQKTSERCAYERNSYFNVNCNYRNLANFIELTPEKLVKGTNILGVEGTAITGGLDTSQITSCIQMFYNAEYMENAPMFDTSNVINMDSMFSGCMELREIPLYDMQNVMISKNMFKNCTCLLNVPPLRVSQEPLDMSNMFLGCDSLTEESLNNILQMCRYTSLNGTLKYIGLSQEQAEICKTLENYEEFIDHGWTTGY